MAAKPRKDIKSEISRSLDAIADLANDLASGDLAVGPYSPPKPEVAALPVPQETIPEPEVAVEPDVAGPEADTQAEQPTEQLLWQAQIPEAPPAREWGLRGPAEPVSPPVEQEVEQDTELIFEPAEPPPIQEIGTDQAAARDGDPAALGPNTEEPAAEPQPVVRDVDPDFDERPLSDSHPAIEESASVGIRPAPVRTATPARPWTPEAASEPVAPFAPPVSRSVVAPPPVGVPVALPKLKTPSRAMPIGVALVVILVVVLLVVVLLAHH